MASGGSYDNVSATATAVVHDDDGGVTVVGSPVALTEGGSAGSYTIALAAAPTANVTVTVTSGDAAAVTVSTSNTDNKLTFMTDSYGAKTVTVTPVDDGDGADESVTITHRSSTGGYGRLIGSVTVSATVDDNDVGLMVGDLATLTEGGSAGSYTVKLAALPSGDVTVAMTSGDEAAVTVSTANTDDKLTFTATNWNQTQAVMLTAVNDDDGSDESVAISHMASGGSYDNVSATATAVVHDDDGVVTVVGSPVALTEGGSAGSYTIALEAAPTANVTVTVMSSDTDAVTVSTSNTDNKLTFMTDSYGAKTVTVTPVDDGDGADESVTITHRSSTGGYGRVVGSVTVSATVDDNDVGLMVGDLATLTEGGSAGSYTVKLAALPSGDVTVAMTSGDEAAVTVSTANTDDKLTFTATNWNQTQAVMLTAVNDDDGSDESVAISHMASGGSYDNVSATATAVVHDNDGGVTVVGSPVALTEGGSAGSYTIALAAAPTANVTVTVTSGDAAAVTVSTSNTDNKLTFMTDSYGAKTVTVTPVDDGDGSDESVTITHRSSTGGYGRLVGSVTVSATVVDGDAGLTLSATSVTVSEGGSTTYTVVLDSMPTGMVGIGIGNPSTGTHDPNLSVSPTSLNFDMTNWNVPKTVSVLAAADDDTVNGTAEFLHTASGGYSAVATLTATEADDDTAGYLFTPASVTTSLAVPEGGSVTYGVRLKTKPSGNTWLDIGWISGDGNLSTNPAQTTLAFTADNWSDYQSVTVAAANDDDAAAGTAVILHRGDQAEYEGVEYRLNVTEDDDDAGLVFSASSVTVRETGSASYSVKLAALPGGKVTVAVARSSSGSQDSDLRVSDGASLTFTTDNWHSYQLVELSADDDADEVNGTAVFSHTASGGDYGGVVDTVVATERDNDAPDYLFTPASVETALAVSENGSAVYGVKLQVQPSGTVWLDIGRISGDGNLSTDPVQTTLVFTTDDWNAYQSVTVKAADDTDAAAGTAVILHRGDQADYAGVEYRLTVTESDDDVRVLLSGSSLTVSETKSASYGVKLAGKPSSSVTVAVAKGVDEDANLSVTGGSSLTFTTGNWNTYKSVTLTASSDDDSGHGTAEFTHTASGGEFAGVVATLTATEADKDPRGFDYLPTSVATSLQVPEGGTVVYQVRPKTRPSANMTLTVSWVGGDRDVSVKPNNPIYLTFTTGNWDDHQMVTLTAVRDADRTDSTATIIHLAGGSDYNGVRDTLTVTEADTHLLFDPATALTSLTVTEQNTLTYGVKLNSTPGNATVTVAVSKVSTSDGDIAISGNANLTFSSTSWDSFKSITITASNDDDSANGTALLKHTVSATPATSIFNGLLSTLTVTESDDDPRGFEYLPTSVATSLQVPEGATVVYGVRPKTRPTANMTLTVSRSAGDGDVSVKPDNSVLLTFEPASWSTYQSVTLTAVEDDDLAAGTATIRHFAGGSDYNRMISLLTATEAENDVAALTLSRSTLLVPEQGINSYTVKLAAEPSAAVTVSVTIASTPTPDSDLRFYVNNTPSQTLAALVFSTTNWNTGQAVTMYAPEDDDAVVGSAELVHSASGGDYASVTGTVTVEEQENDSAGYVFTPLSPLSVSEGGSGTYGVKLLTRPSAKTTLTVTRSSDTSLPSNDDDVRLLNNGTMLDDTGHLTFTFTTTSWNSYQSVTVTVRQDNDALSGTGYIAHSASGSDYASTTDNYLIEEDDDDTASVLVIPASFDVTEGSEATYTVALATAPSGKVTVAIASADTAAVTVSAASLTFAVNNYATAQTVTVTAVNDDDGSDESVAITHTASSGSYDNVSATATAVVHDDDGVVTVVGSPVALTEGGSSGSYTIALEAAPTANVTVTVMSSDTAAVTVSTSNTDNKLTFMTDSYGAKTVTVTPVDDGDGADESVTITHSSSTGGYGRVVGSVTVSATVDDNDVGLMVGDLATLTEGGSAGSYTVKLAALPSGDVTVAMTSGDEAAVTVSTANTDDKLTFTATNWNQTQAVMLTAVADSDGSDESVAISHMASGGSYDNVSATATAVVHDDDGVVTVVGSPVALTEGGSAGSYTIALEAAPTANVTVTVMSSDTDAVTVSTSNTDNKLTFMTDSYGAKTVTVTPVDDGDGADESVTITHRSSTGGYGRVVGSVTVSATVDDNDVGLMVGDLATLTEGGSAGSYTVKLAALPSGDVTVAMTSGDEAAVTVSTANTDDKLTFTATNWNQTQAVMLTAVADSDGSDESVAISHMASGGSYDNVSATATAVVHDDDGVVTVVGSPVALTEGGSAGSYTIALAAAPTANVTVTVMSSDTAAVTVSTSNTDNKLTFMTDSYGAKTVTVTPVDDGDGADESVTITHRSSTGGYGRLIGSVTVSATVDDNDVGLMVGDLATLTEGGSAGSYTVKLAALPSGDVTVAMTSGDEAAVTVSTANTDDKLTFTATNWNQTQAVMLTAVADSDGSDESVAISHMASGGSYDNVSATATAVVHDDDGGVTVVGSPVALTEGGSAGSYTIALAAAPTANVTVTVTSGDAAAVTVSTSNTDNKLTFMTDSYGAKTITVTPVDDGDGADESVTITHRSSTGGYGRLIGSVTVSATVDDNDVGLMVGDLATLTEGGSAGSYTVKLAALPSGDVTVAMTSGDEAAVTVSTANTDDKLTFTATNWNQTQAVMLTAVADSDGSDESVAISHMASGGSYDNVSATATAVVHDDDGGVTVVGSPVALTEGGSAGSYTIALAAAPTANVTVTVMSSDTAAVTVSTSNTDNKLTFMTDSYGAKTVTVTPVDDGDGADESVTITHRSSTGGYGRLIGSVTVSATVDDNDVGLMVGDLATLTEGGSAGSYTVKLAALPSGDVTVAMTSGDEAAVTVSTANTDDKLTFTATNWNQTQAVMLTAVADSDGSDESVVITHTASSGSYDNVSATATAVVEDNDGGVTVVGSPVALTEGGSAGSYTIALVAAPTANVTVTVTSGDAAAVTVSTSNTDNKLTFMTDSYGAKTVTVTPVDDGDGADESVTITHRSSTGGYGRLIGSVTVSATVDDNDVGLMVGDLATLTEGGSAGSYTVKLAALPSGDVTVAMTSGDEAAVTVSTANTDDKLTFTATNWNQTQAVMLTAVADSDGSDESVAISHMASGGSYDNVSATATAVVHDDDGGVTVVGSPVALTEGGSAGSYTIALAAAPTANVTVTVTSGDAAAVTVSTSNTDNKLTFMTDSYGAKTVTVTPVDDGDGADESVTITHRSSTGGYGRLIGSVTVSATVDDNDVGLMVGDLATLTEGGSAGSYTVKLAALPSGDVTVAMTSGDEAAVTVSTANTDDKLTFTATNWNQTQAVMLTAVADSDGSDESVAISHMASGGSYDNVSATATAVVHDDDGVVTVVGSPVALTEGGSAGSYTIALEAAPTANVTVTVMSSDTDAVTVSTSNTDNKLTFMTDSYGAKTVTVTPVDDGDGADESVTITHRSSTGGYGRVVGSVTVSATVDDNDVGLMVGDLATLTEGGSAGSYTVKLAALPSGDVTVAMTSGDEAAVTVSTANTDDKLTFTATNWNQTQAVMLTAVADSDGSDESVAISHMASGGSYDNVSATATAVVHDDDGGVTVVGSPVVLTEGGSAGSYTIALAAAPTANVTVTVTSSDTDAVTVSTSNTDNKLTFMTDSYGAKTVTVTPVDDGDGADESVTITHRSSTGGYGRLIGSVTVSATVDDNDVGLMVGDLATLTEGGSAGSYTVKLAALPSGDVTVAMTSGDEAAVTVSTANTDDKLTFTATNWNQTQAVMLTAVADSDGSDESVAISHMASGGSYDNVSATATAVVHDDDGGVTVVGSPVALTEGGSAGSYTIALAAAPTANVTVTVTSGDAAAVTVSTSNTDNKLTFMTDSYGAKTVTVTPVDDGDGADESVTITHRSSTGGYGRVVGSVTVSATVDDNDVGLMVGDLATLTEGGSAGSYTVKLAALPSGDVTVAMTSGDEAAVTVSTANTDDKLTFTATNWNQTQAVMLTAVADSDGSDESVAISHMASGGSYDNVSATATAVVHDDDGGVTVVGSPVALTEGGSAGSYTIALAAAPTANVTVTVTSSDTDAVTVSTSNTDNKLTFMTDSYGAKTITVTPVDDGDGADESVTITHRSSTGGYGRLIGSVTVSATVDDNDVGLMVGDLATLTEGGSAGSYTVKLAALPSGDVTVAMTSGDEAAVTVSTANTDDKLTFTATNWNQTQAVMLTAVADSDGSDESVAISHMASGGSYDNVSATATAVVHDDDGGVTVVGSPVALTEGGSAGSYTIALAAAPTANVTVTVMSSDTDAVTVSTSNTDNKLTFMTDSYGAKTVTVTPVDDGDGSDESVTITHRSSTGGYDRLIGSVTVSATVDDDDTTLTLSATSLTVSEGGSVTYTVVLDAMPTGAVAIAIANPADGTHDMDLSVSPTSLNFDATNWNVPKTVSVLAAADDDAVNGTALFKHTATGGGYGSATATLAATEADDDSVGLALSTTSLSVPEGGSTRYGVKLTADPLSSVTVSVERSTDGTQDEDLSLSEGSTLTFAADQWNVWQSVTVSAAPDDDTVDGTAVFVHRASVDGATVAATLVATEDDDTVSVSPRVVREALSQTAIAALTHVEWALEDRFDSLPEIGIEGRLAGGSMDGSAAQGDSAMLLDGLPVSAKGRLVRSEPESGGLSAEDVVSGTEFMIGRATDGGQFGVLWMQGSVSSFNSGGEAPVDGDAWSVTLGADYRFGRSLAGLALSLVRTEGKYQDGPNSGAFDVRATALYPYFRHRPTSGLSFWGAVGYGTGRFEARPAGSEPLVTDLKMLQAILGFEQSVLSRAERSGFELSLKGSVKWHRMTTEAIPELAALTAQSTRTRIGIEASWNWEKEDGSVLTPTLALAARYDSGTDQGGFGLEGNLGLAWTSPDRRLQASLTGRTLLAHQVDRRREWTLSATFAYDPYPDSDYGLSAKLSPTWRGEQTGTAASATESLSGIQQTRSSGSNGLEGELRFGFPQMGGMASGALSTRGVVDDENLRLGVAYSFALNSAEDYRFRLGFGVDAERKAGRFAMHGGEINLSLEW